MCDLIVAAKAQKCKPVSMLEQTLGVHALAVARSVGAGSCQWKASEGPGRGQVRLDRPDGLHSSAFQGGLDGRQLGTVVPACASFRNRCRPCGTVPSDHDGSQPALNEPLTCCHRPAYTAGGAPLLGSPRTCSGTLIVAVRTERDEASDRDRAHEAGIHQNPCHAKLAKGHVL